jgi:hypothetical protein
MYLSPFTPFHAPNEPRQECCIARSAHMIPKELKLAVKSCQMQVYTTPEMKEKGLLQ